MNFIFVDRGSKDSRQATLKAIQDHVESWKPGDRPLLIFPEGTTSNGTGLTDFRKGAFVPGVPVRPILLSYAGDWVAATHYREANGRVERTSDQEWAENYFG